MAALFERIDIFDCSSIQVPQAIEENHLSQLQGTNLIACLVANIRELWAYKSYPSCECVYDV